MAKKPRRLKLRPKRLRSFRSIKHTFYSGIRKANKNRPPSSLELLVYSWLDAANIPYKKEKAVGRCHADIFIEPNILVEINGKFWHRCECCYPEPTTKNLSIRLRDAKRYSFFEKKGFKVYIIKECEIEKNPSKVKRDLLKLCRQALKDLE